MDFNFSKPNLFNIKNQFVLFSGTKLNGNSPFRHLNDLLFYLVVLDKKEIPSSQIYLVIDKEVLIYLNTKTQNKQVSILGFNGTFLEYFNSKISDKNIINISEFERSFKRKNNDLVFLASGHGSVKGLAIDNGLQDHESISPDYFEKISNRWNRTYLIMSQCQAAAFHHLDTRLNICVLGASDYQSSQSIPINILTNDVNILNNLAFENNIPINPFVFSFYLVVPKMNELINSKKKNLINLFKYIASVTNDYLLQANKRTFFILRNDILALQQNQFLKFEYDNAAILQQPYLLNKILAARTKIN